MSKIKVLADLVPSERPIPGLQVAIFSLCLYMTESERSKLSLLTRALIPS